MSFPSLNARSAALPPPATPPKSRKFLSQLSLSGRRKSGHDLPLMTIPDSPIRPTTFSPRDALQRVNDVLDSRIEGSGVQVVSTPEEALRQWRRSRSSTISNGRGHGKSASVAHTSCTSPSSARLSDQYVFRSASSDGVPQSQSVGHSRSFSAEEPLVSPRAIDSVFGPSPPPPAHPESPPPPSTTPHSHLHSRVLPTQPSVDFFNAILLSRKTVNLPPQPFTTPRDNPTPGTLVQLQVAGSSFIIPLTAIECYPSHLARFATGCTSMEDENAMESDATFSEIETDRETTDLPSPRGSDSSENLDIPSSPPSPPFNLRASSMTKLQKLGVLPPRDSSNGFLDPLTPRPDLTTFARTAHPHPPRRPLRAPSRTAIKFLNVLLFRSPEPYAAVSFFFATGELLPSLRPISEGETECKSCPLCGDADRVRKLREVEAEAQWLGLEALVRLCRRERLGPDASAVNATAPRAAAVMRRGEGWI